MIHKTVFTRRAVLGLALVLMVSIVFGGCASVHRKFTRKKKNVQDDEVIPVLNPIDYPPPVFTSMDRYQQFYDLFKIWHKDIITVLDDGPSDKQILYKFSQMAVQLEGMKGLLQGAALDRLNAALDEYGKVVGIYEKSAAFRSEMEIKSRVKNLGEIVVDDLKPDLVKKDLID